MHNLDVTANLHSIATQYPSEDAMIEDLSKDPSNLMKLFETASNPENHWHVTNAASFNKIFKKIEALDAGGKLDDEQVQKIISINNEIYPSINDNGLKTGNINFFSSHINADNVYQHLQHAKEVKADDHIKKCLDFIEKETGIKCNVTDLPIVVESPSEISFPELSKHLKSLAKVFDNQIDIKLTPADSCDLNEFKKFIEEHGKSIGSLNLVVLGSKVDNEFIDQAMKFCPNIKNLWVNSENVSEEGLKNLNRLTQLTSLYLNCKNLTTLGDLPEGMEQLNMDSCYQLKEISNLPSTIIKLDVSGSDILKLPTLPNSLRAINISACYSLKELPTFSNNITEINISKCDSLSTLPDFPKSLNVLYISECNGLIKIPNLPDELNIFSVSNCNLSKLPDLPPKLTELSLFCLENLTTLKAFPETLLNINLNLCAGLETIPELPQGLKFLKLYECSGLIKLPPLPTSLTELNLIYSLTDEARLSALALLLDRNIDAGLNLYRQFEIEDKNIIFKLIIEKLVGKIEEQEDNIPVFIDALKRKIDDPTTEPSTQSILARIVLENLSFLELHEEHPLAQTAINIYAAGSVEGAKNPFSIFKKLSDQLKIPTNFAPPSMKVEGVPVAINMNRLGMLSKAGVIHRGDLPENVTREAFETLATNLQNKVNDNPDAAKALEQLGTTWDTISTPIFGDPSKRLATILDLTGENVSDIEAKWKAVLNWIMKQSTAPKDNSFFTDQEEAFIKVMMGIQNCSEGKEIGIALTYEQLEPEYKYNLSLKKPPETIMEKQIEAEKNLLINDLKEFVRSQASSESMIDNLKEFGSKNMTQVFTFVRDEEFWDEDENGDYALNELGAIELLNAVKDAEENENLPVKQFVGTIIRNLIVNEFSGTNALMKKLTDIPLSRAENEDLLRRKHDVVDDDMLKGLEDGQTDNVREGAHQSKYLRNLIGPLVGASTKISFDHHTGVLYENLIAKERNAVLETFFEFVTPKQLVDETVKVVNQNPKENRELLSPYLSDNQYLEDGRLTRKGALDLLQKLGYLEQR